MNVKKIDVNFDFTSDCDAKSDPDSASRTMQKYHSLIYSKRLPNGEEMKLTIGNTSYNYLTWKNYRFGSDSIIASFRYKKYQPMLVEIAKHISDIDKYYENYTHKSYTLGGEIIFPKRMGGINQSRGCSKFISDRFDLTLECIRRFYQNETSPLSNVLEKDKSFFDLFLDFKGYVDYFFLNDLVSRDYKNIYFWLKNDDFKKNFLPETVNDYLVFIDKELDFVEKRNSRIQKFIEEA